MGTPSHWRPQKSRIRVTRTNRTRGIEPRRLGNDRTAPQPLASPATASLKGSARWWSAGPRRARCTPWTWTGGAASRTTRKPARCRAASSSTTAHRRTARREQGVGVTRSAGGHRRYDRPALERLRLLRALSAMGMPLAVATEAALGMFRSARR
ncbi:MerR family transcriptional regulator [Streptomyces sp. NPDC047725]|uniref:MerR family transcriptional regulator n=1 Tax=Streptomyces sp. NPDC047725 TaxID=3365487 RepID=UPI0037177CDE